MKKTWAIAATLSAAAGAVQAGGIERSNQSVAILFEEGNYAEVTYSSVNPSVSGTSTTTYSYTGGTATGDMAESYEQLDFGLKFAVSENLDVALIKDSPVGADVLYPSNGVPPFPFGTDHVFAGGNADVDSTALGLHLRYKFDNNFSVIGGVRHVTAGGNLGIPFFNNYLLEVEDSSEIGFTAGVAWEKPEIAARVALTYHSATTHSFGAMEGGLFTGSADPIATGNFEVEIPQAINLDFQTGIAKDTLLFGSVRWVDWTAFDISPPHFTPIAGPIVSYDDDVITYNLGLGRRLNDNWSVAATLGYEEAQGGFTGNLGPTDGFTSLGVGATYTYENFKISGGIRHIWIGDADTAGPPIGDPLNIPAGSELANFRDNTAWAWGLRMGFYF